MKRAGGNPIAKIMIPLVGHVNELVATRKLLEAEARPSWPTPASTSTTSSAP